MTIYAVFICQLLSAGSDNVYCAPTAFRNLPTVQACEERREFMSGLDSATVRAVCMAKTVATWKPVR